MTYQIINDPEQLRAFIDLLPEVKKPQAYYVFLAARKKYLPEPVEGFPSQLRVNVAVCSKKHIYNSIELFEVKQGAYRYYNKVLKQEQVVPTESLVVYMRPTPRDLNKAAYLTANSINKALYEQKSIDPIKEAYSAVHSTRIPKSKADKIFVDLEVDIKEVDLGVLDHIFPKVPEDPCYRVIETRGGYHILINSEKASTQIEEYNKKAGYSLSKNWYLKVREALPVDSSGDQELPVPGATQGGFVPKLL